MTEMVDEAKNAAGQIAGEVEATLATVAQSLRDASASALEISEEASAALSNAAAEVVRVAESLSRDSINAVKSMTRQAANEVQEHPIASIAAALTAVGTLVGVIVAARNRKAAADSVPSASGTTKHT